MEKVTYQFYVDTYQGGSISPEEWPAAEREARATVARYQRIYTVTEPEPNSLQMAVCAVAEVLVEHAHADSIQEDGAISSASIGSVSVSYATPSSTERTESRKSLKKDCYEAARLHIDIYRGC